MQWRGTGTRTDLHYIACGLSAAVCFFRRKVLSVAPVFLPCTSSPRHYSLRFYNENTSRTEPEEHFTDDTCAGVTEVKTVLQYRSGHH